MQAGPEVRRFRDSPSVLGNRPALGSPASSQQSEGAAAAAPPQVSRGLSVCLSCGLSLCLSHRHRDLSVPSLLGSGRGCSMFSPGLGLPRRQGKLITSFPGSCKETRPLQRASLAEAAIMLTVRTQFCKEPRSVVRYVHVGSHPMSLHLICRRGLGQTWQELKQPRAASCQGSIPAGLRQERVLPPVLLRHCDCLPSNIRLGIRTCLEKLSQH